MKEHHNTYLDTPINQHIKEKNHSFDFNHVQILDVEHNMRKRRQSEIIHISLHNNSINRQNDTTYLHNPFMYLIKDIFKSDIKKKQ